MYICKYTHTGMSHSLFVTAGGTVHTCGDGREGRLGHGDDSIHLKPAPLGTLAGLVRIYIGIRKLVCIYMSVYV